MTDTTLHNDAAACCGPDCCPDDAGMTKLEDAEAIHAQVREGYARIAREGTLSAGCCDPSGDPADGGCCGPTTITADHIAAAVGYDTTELETVPDGANMGLSCGNPTAIAALNPGEVVLDLGSGGGFDCFIAGPKVGPTGRVIGVDMTADMLAKARKNIVSYRGHAGMDNVEFRLGEIENIPAADASIDVVISNCVINLSPDKPRVWREIARVLKPGGRVAISDLALLKPLPAAVREDFASLIGCIAGASLIEDIRTMAREAGLVEIELTPKPQYIDSMTNSNDPLYQQMLAKLPEGTKASDYLTSLDIAARKTQ